MTKTEQQIAIARACGHRIEDLERFPTVAIRDDGTRYKIPDYLNDLNAMHEAEKTLNRDQDNEFGLSMYDCYWGAVRKITPDLLGATAKQRAEALLKTLGKWKE